MKTHPFFIICIGLLATAFISTSHADIYKWRDANGVLHYGNTLPAQAAGAAMTTFDNHGQVVTQTAAALTDKQRQALAAKNAEEEKRLQAQQAQQRSDNALINTYTTPQEIDEARDHNLALTQLMIESLNSRMTPLLAKRANLIKNSGSNVSKNPNYVSNEAEIASLQAQLTQNQQALVSTRQKYNQEKARYIELTGKMPAH